VSWAEDTKLRLQVFAISLVVICPGFLIWQIAETKTQIASRNWPSTPGEVREIVAKPWLDSKGNTKYYGRAVYR
jgi:hypothetical protein